MKKLKDLIISYTLLFAILILAIMILFRFYDKSFVWINVSYDGIDQHLVNLYTLRNLLINFFKTGSIPYFTYHIGYGMDMFANYTYYIFGDFISYISVFFKESFMGHLYNIIIVIRVYLAGLAFIIYTNYKKYDRYYSLIGTLIYLFSTYTVFAMARHPYFINPMIIFPFLLIGVDKIILKKEKIFFTLIVAIMFISSFYFGYMMSLIVAVYGIILAFTHFKDKKEIFKRLLITFGCAIIGLIISSGVLLPTLSAFFNSARTGNGIYLYTGSYYLRLIESLITVIDTDNWSIFGMCSLVVISLVLFIKNRKNHRVLNYFLLFLVILLTIPFIASIVDCMSYPNNRWNFITCFIISIITIEVLSKNYKFNINKALYIESFYFLIIMIINIILKGFNIQILISMILTIIFTLLVYYQKRFKHYKVILLILVVLNLGYNNYYLFSSNGTNYINQFTISNPSDNYKNNLGNIKHFEEAIKYLNETDPGFYNVLVYPNAIKNLSLMNNYYSESYFYSVVPKNYLDLAVELENSDLVINKEILNFNYRTRINTLLNNKYLVTNNVTYQPFGYSLINSIDNDTFIFINNYYSPFAKLYTNSLNTSYYDSLSPLEKEDALLKYYLDDNSENKNLNYHYESINYNSNIGFTNTLTINQDFNKLVINADPINNGEVYLRIKNIKYEPFRKLQKKSFQINVMTRDLNFMERREDKLLNPYYFTNNDLLINLGYYYTFDNDIEVLFNDYGTYSFDSLEVIKVTFDDYSETINKLNTNFNLIKEDNNYLAFNVDIKEDGILAFTTNYNDNFKVYVDDQLVPSMVVNKYFLGTKITQGNHKIELVYENKLIKKSFFVSLFGIILFAGLIIYERKYKNEKN